MRVLLLCFLQFSGVLTWHNNNARTGENVQEQILTPANVHTTTFGKIWSVPVDGQIYAQPLYLPGSPNLVFVPTQNDSVYALNADTGQIVWQVSLSAPYGGVPIPCTDLFYECNISPVFGITSTPVIDPSTGTIYVLAETKEGSISTPQWVHRLHALSVQSGAEKFGGPAIIAATAPGTKVVFSGQTTQQRAALTLANGNVYVAWRGQHGWVMAYSASTLQQVGVFNTSPHTNHAGIWQSGAGLAVDASGNVYFATSDADFNPPLDSYGDSLIKLDPSLNFLDYFTPMDQSCRWNKTVKLNNDLDLGSAGPMLLGNLVFLAGKGGTPCEAAAPIYITSQSALGGYDPNQDHVVQEVAGAPYGYWSNPAYWNGWIYEAGQTPTPAQGDYLDQYTWSGSLMGSVPTARSLNRFHVGATPSVSANGTMNGIVWAIERLNSLSVNGSNALPGILFAFDATNVRNVLYTSKQNSARDTPGPATKFMTPTIANGHVYVGTLTELDCYGLLGGGEQLSVARRRH